MHVLLTWPGQKTRSGLDLIMTAFLARPETSVGALPASRGWVMRLVGDADALAKRFPTGDPKDLGAEASKKSEKAVVEPQMIAMLASRTLQGDKSR